MRLENGGFLNIPKPNSRLDLEYLLDKYHHIRDTRDQYSQSARSNAIENPIITQKPPPPAQATVEPRTALPLNNIEGNNDQIDDDILSPLLNISLNRSPANIQSQNQMAVTQRSSKLHQKLN